MVWCWLIPRKKNKQITKGPSFTAPQAFDFEPSMFAKKQIQTKMVNPMVEKILNNTSNKQTKQTKQKQTANTHTQNKKPTQNKTNQNKTIQSSTTPCERELKIDHTGASHHWRQGGDTLWQSKIPREI